MSDDIPVFETRADYIEALIDDVEAIAVEEIENAGRALRRRARKIAAEYANKIITPQLWESRLKGNAEEQASVAVQFLRTARNGLVLALEDMNARR